MIAEVIAIGTELLMGQTVNTNAHFLAGQLQEIGISLYHQVTVGDNRDRLKAQLEQSLDRSDIVITTGGLGPTQDDITKKVLAEWTGSKLVQDESALQKMKERGWSSERMARELSQTYVPEGSMALNNSVGVAIGILMEYQDKMIVCLPGPPREMEAVFMQEVRPLLQARQNQYFLSKTFYLVGMTEAEMEAKVRDLIDQQTNPTLATYVKVTGPQLRLTACASSKEKAQAMLEPWTKIIAERFGSDLLREGEGSIEESIVALLDKYQLTIAVAESCTGGLISSQLINVAGISQFYKQGWITYSNQSKMTQLGVSKETLANYGAVSQQVASEMAEGAVRIAKTDIGLSVTGVAGPGASEEKPPGLAYIGLSIQGRTKVFAIDPFQASRNYVRRLTSRQALYHLRREILAQFE